MDLGNFNQPQQRYIKTINLTREQWDANVDYLKKLIAEFEPRFEWNEQLTDIYKNTILYFLGNSQSKYDLNKGLYFYGDTGCGKSLILTSVFKQYTRILGVNSYRVVSTTDIIKSVQKNGLFAINEFIESDSHKPIVLYIDDFGAGNSKVNSYGTVIDVFTELVTQRYPYYSRHNTLTHFSSNIMPSEFEERFNARISSRMSEMCNLIYMPQIDYRKR